jgi:hypothetical protein
VYLTNGIQLALGLTLLIAPLGAGAETDRGCVNRIWQAGAAAASTESSPKTQDKNEKKADKAKTEEIKLARLDSKQTRDSKTPQGSYRPYRCVRE